MPFRAKTDLMIFIVFEEVVHFIIKMLGHLKCVSTMIKNILFIAVQSNQYKHTPMDAKM